MVISELIAKLESIKAVHGDIPVAVDDNDTHWIMAIAEIEFSAGRVVLSAVDYCEHQTTV